MIFSKSRSVSRPKASRSSSSNRARLGVEALEDRCLMSADMVLQWNQHALDAVKNDFNVGQVSDEAGPTKTARALAIVQAAVFDAADAVQHIYTPYLVNVLAQPGTSINAAIAQAAHDSLVALYPHQAATFNAELTQSLQGIAPGAAQKGIQLGQYVAAQILAARQNDGSNHNVTYTYGDQPGQWRPDPLHPTQTPLGDVWGSCTPFVIQSGDQFQVPPPPALNSLEYAIGFNLTKAFGGDGVHTPTLRTPDETVTANFWSYDGSPQIGTPPRLYNQILQVIARQEGNSLIQNARLFALANMAMADASIAAWDTKYVYNFWRPVAGIREADPGTGPTGKGDGNPLTKGDPNWTPIGAAMDNGGPNGPFYTPPFPAYTSGHATIGESMFRVVADFYHTDHIGFSFQSDEYNGTTIDPFGHVRPAITRHYDSLSQASWENAISRIFNGVHWIWDAVDGVKQGQQIADYTMQHALQALTPSGSPAATFVLAHNTGPATVFLPQAVLNTPGYAAIAQFLATTYNTSTQTSSGSSTNQSTALHNAPPANNNLGDTLNARAIDQLLQSSLWLQ